MQAYTALTVKLREIGERIYAGAVEIRRLFEAEYHRAQRARRGNSQPYQGKYPLGIGKEKRRFRTEDQNPGNHLRFRMALGVDVVVALIQAPEDRDARLGEIAKQHDQAYGDRREQAIQHTEQQNRRTAATAARETMRSRRQTKYSLKKSSLTVWLTA